MIFTAGSKCEIWGHDEAKLQKGFPPNCGAFGDMIRDAHQSPISKIRYYPKSPAANPEEQDEERSSRACSTKPGLISIKADSSGLQDKERDTQKHEAWRGIRRIAIAMACFKSCFGYRPHLITLSISIVSCCCYLLAMF